MTRFFEVKKVIKFFFTQVRNVFSILTILLFQCKELLLTWSDHYHSQHVIGIFHIFHNLNSTISPLTASIGDTEALIEKHQFDIIYFRINIKRRCFIRLQIKTSRDAKSRKGFNENELRVKNNESDVLKRWTNLKIKNYRPSKKCNAMARKKIFI